MEIRKESLMEYLNGEMPEHKFRLFCSDPYTYRARYVAGEVPIEPMADRKKIKHAAIAEALGCKEAVGFDASFEVVDAKDWRTKDAQKERDAILGAGKLPLLTPDMESVNALADVVKKGEAWAHVQALENAKADMLSTYEAEFDSGPHQARPLLATPDHVVLVKVVDKLGSLTDTLRTSPWAFQAFYNGIVCRGDGEDVLPALLVIEDAAPAYTSVIFTFDRRDNVLYDRVSDCMEALEMAKKGGWNLPTFISFPVGFSRHFVDFCNTLVWSGV